MNRLGCVAIGLVMSLFVACGSSQGGASKDGAGDASDGGETNDVSDASDSNDLNDSAPEVGPDSVLEVGSEDAVDAETGGPEAHECTFPVDVGCFTGDVCASSQVRAGCVDGKWRCPAGSQGTEFCANPDSRLAQD
jgi:hypothetical protein